MVRGMGICRIDPTGAGKRGYALNFMRPQRSGWLAAARALLLVSAVAPFVPRIHHCVSANQMELRWRGFGVAACMVEMEPVKLADGTAALVCIDCDVIGLEHEVAQGGPMRTAGAIAGVAKKQRSTRRWAERHRIRHRSRNQLP